MRHYIEGTDQFIDMPDDATPEEQEMMMNESFPAVQAVGATSPPPAEAEITPEWAGKHPNLYGAVMAARNTLGPLVEAGAAAGGGVLGAGAGIPTGPGAIVSGAAGAGLGYAASRRLLDAIDEAMGTKRPATLPQAAIETGKDVALGATMEVGGQAAGQALSAVAGKVASKVASKVGNAAKKMYASSLKLETGKGIPQAERAARIKTGLEVGAVPTEKSVSKVQTLIDDIDEAIQRPIEEAAKEKNISVYPWGDIRGRVVKTSRIRSSLDDLKAKFEDQALPDADLAAIDKAKELFKARRGDEIPIEVAQRIKKGTYTQLKGKYGKLGAAEIESEKTIARGLKDEIYLALEKQHPELAELGKKEGAYIALKDSLEKAVKRVQNRDIIGIGTPIAMGAGGVLAGTPGAIAAFAAKVADMPVVKARLAIALNRASQKALAKQAVKQAAAGTKGRAIKQAAAGAKGRAIAVTTLTGLRENDEQ